MNPDFLPENRRRAAEQVARDRRRQIVREQLRSAVARLLDALQVAATVLLMLWWLGITPGRPLLIAALYLAPAGWAAGVIALRWSLDRYRAE